MSRSTSTSLVRSRMPTPFATGPPTAPATDRPYVKSPWPGTPHSVDRPGLSPQLTLTGFDSDPKPGPPRPGVWEHPLGTNGGRGLGRLLLHLTLNAWPKVHPRFALRANQSSSAAHPTYAAYRGTQIMRCETPRLRRSKPLRHAMCGSPSPIVGDRSAAFSASALSG